MLPRVSCIVLWFSVMLTGCASNKPIIPSTVEGESTVTHAATETAELPDAHEDARHADPVIRCSRTRRDLTVAWTDRQYRCVQDGRRVALQKAYAGYPQRRKYRRLIADRPINPSPDVITAVVETRPLSPAERVRSYTQDSSMARTVNQDQTVQQNLSRATAQTIRVWFAHSQAVLGEQGMAKSLALIPDVMAARRITLRGVFEETELPIAAPTPLDRERFSVARALSVRALWIKQGVEPDKLTIRHHQPQLAGRYVEVVLHD